MTRHRNQSSVSEIAYVVNYEGRVDVLDRALKRRCDFSPCNQQNDTRRDWIQLRDHEQSFKKHDSHVSYTRSSGYASAHPTAWKPKYGDQKGIHDEQR